ncbi:hypothetical protein evm_015367 [Chilo suppressalis]|nr:hypothetical protein evm_015367 [Chilo suppressalis]
MHSEGCVCKEPIESLHLPRLGQHSSGGNGSAELDFCAYKTSEGCVRGLCTRDVCEGCLARNAIFSQPTVAYPIPQATVSVFFRVGDKYLYHVEDRGVPSLVFRIEGHHTDHDIRHIKLTPDWILGALQAKIKFFQRIEEIGLF